VQRVRCLQLLQSDVPRVSVFCRFNSPIVDFISLLAGFISLFGHLGNFLRMLRDNNNLPARFGPRDSLEPRFSQYLPVDHGTMEAAMPGRLEADVSCFCHGAARAPYPGIPRFAAEFFAELPARIETDCDRD
jgi:hypothetical protein